jgi:hypothetical protein
LPPQSILVSDWSISKKNSPLKLLGQMNQNLVGSTCGRFGIMFAQNRVVAMFVDESGRIEQSL